MPRVRRRLKTRIALPPLCRMVRLWLECGHHFLFGAGDPADTPENYAALWQAYGDEVLADWIVEHPGTRPAAWWKLEAPEPRRRVDGGQERHNVKLSFGLPNVFTCADDWSAEYESEADYLARHDLLTPTERNLIHAE